MKYLGIDIGSSFIKAVLLDLDQYRMISTRKSRSPQKEKNCDPNIFEIPAEEMVDTVRTLIDGYTSEYKDIQGVLISTQMHGFVYSVPERKDMYVSWQDMRCMNPMEGYEGSYLEFLQEQISPEDMQENGVYLKPSLGICNLYAMLQADKSLPGDGELHTLGSYLIHALTGNNICHVMNAAPMGIVNVKQHSLDHRIMTFMGMERVQLPVLAEDDYQICGTYRSNGCELKIHPDYGDMQVAILGSGVQSGDAVANVATGAQVIRYAEDFKCGSYEIRPYFEKGYLYTISNMPAGRNLDVLVKFISECAGLVTGKEPDMGTVWEKIHSCLGEADPELKVEASFYKNPYFPDGGYISGITHSNLHIGNLFMAAFADMAETYWKFIRQLGERPENISRIICSGGVNWKTPQLRYNLEQISKKKCVLSTMADEALSGMYQLAMVCSGKCANLEECRKYPLQEEKDEFKGES